MPYCMYQHDEQIARIVLFRHDICDNSVKHAAAAVGSEALSSLK